FATVKTLQLRIPTYGMRSRLTPEKAQQRIALFTQPPEPLSSATGVFPRNQPHITSQGLAVCESRGISQEHLGRQCRDRSDPWMRHQQPCSGTCVSLLFDSLV